MADHRRKTAQHTEWKKSARGPNGRGLCRVCLTEVPKGRRTFCSDACVERFQLATGSSGWVRLRVMTRDNGICSACGRDCERTQRVVRRLADRFGRTASAEEIERLRARVAAPLGYDPKWSSVRLLRYVELLMRLGWSAKQAHDMSKSLWQADHTVPLIEGGEATMANLRTLCVPCHTKETSELAARRAAERKQNG